MEGLKNTSEKIKKHNDPVLNTVEENQCLIITGRKFKKFDHEVDGSKEVLDDEAAGHVNILRLTAKAEGDAA